MLMIIIGLIKQEPSYLYTSADRENKLEQFEDFPAIIVNGTYGWYPSRWIVEYSEYSEIFLCNTDNDLSCLSEAAVQNEGLREGFLLYVLRSSASDEEIMNKIQEQIPLSNYERVLGGRDRVFWCIAEE